MYLCTRKTIRIATLQRIIVKCGCKDKQILNQCAIFHSLFWKKTYKLPIFNKYYQ